MPGPGAWFQHETAGWLLLLGRWGDWAMFHSGSLGTFSVLLPDWPMVYPEGAEEPVDINALVPWAEWVENNRGQR